MNIGAVRVAIRIPHSRGLKDKRRIAISLRQRVGSKFNVSIAEVEMNDSIQILILGIVCVSNSAVHTSQTLSRVVEFIESERPDIEVIDLEEESIGF